MEVTAQYRGGVAFEVAARDHRITCDQPKDNSGEDAGMTPPELLLASLATCAGYYAVEYLRTRGLPGDDLGVRVVASKALKPARLEDLRIELTLPELDERHVAGISRAVKACLIHNTLLSAPSIETVVLTASSVLV
jgi:putative redox protein